MPKPKKSKAPKGMSPEEVAAANKSGFDHAMNAMPLLQFDDMMGNFGSFASDITDPFTQLFDQLIGRGEQTTGMAPSEPVPLAVAQEPEPAPTPPPQTPNPGNGWGSVATDADAINWARKQGKITDAEASWLQRWQGEANDGNNWVDGSGGTKNWDYMSSGLTDQNKGTVDKFYNAVSGNWGGGQPQPQQPQQPQAAAGVPNGVNMTPEQLAAMQKFQGYGRGMV